MRKYWNNVPHNIAVWSPLCAECAICAQPIEPDFAPGAQPLNRIIMRSRAANLAWRFGVQLKTGKSIRGGGVTGKTRDGQHSWRRLVPLSLQSFLPDINSCWIKLLWNWQIIINWLWVLIFLRILHYLPESGIFTYWFWQRLDRCRFVFKDIFKRYWTTLYVTARAATVCFAGSFTTRKLNLERTQNYDYYRNQNQKNLLHRQTQGSSISRAGRLHCCSRIKGDTGRWQTVRCNAVPHGTGRLPPRYNPSDRWNFPQSTWSCDSGCFQKLRCRL